MVLSRESIIGEPQLLDLAVLVTNDPFLLSDPIKTTIKSKNISSIIIANILTNLGYHSKLYIHLDFPHYIGSFEHQCMPSYTH